MKTNKLLKEISTRAFLFLIILFIAVSCRKDNDNIDPILPTPPDDPNPSAVFGDKPVNILSDYEKTNNLNFPGNTILKSGTGLLGGAGHVIWEGVSLVGEAVWEAYNYHHTEDRFDSIDDQLTEMQAQITDLNQTMKAMSNSLNISFADLKTLIYTKELNSQIINVQSVMDSSTFNGLMWYPKTARLYHADTNNTIMRYQMQILKEEAPLWAQRLFNNTSADTYMPAVIGQIQGNICPPLGGSGDNALDAYTESLIGLCQGKVTDSISAMNAYLLLESYFLTIINYQFQAATVYVNAANFIDPTGISASDFWQAHMVVVIPGEVKVFLENVDYLAANLSEYRTQQRFEHDMQYADAGLAPDNMFYNVFARSQFLANLLNYSLGLTPSIVSGHIMVPDHYGPNGNLSPDSLSVKVGSKSLNSTSKKHPSVIPYTYWAPGYVCTPDHQWRTYRLTSPDADWATGPQTVTVDGTGDSPWTHYVPITGTVTPLYYNPRNPQQHSATKTDLCTVPFGYFAANWQWGYLYLTNSPISTNSSISSGWEHIGRFNFYSFNYNIWSKFSPDYYTPFGATTDKNDKPYKQGPDIIFTYPNNTPGSMKVSGITSHTDHFYIVANSLNCAVSTSTVLPTSSIATPGLRAWAWYKSYYGMQGNGGVDLTVNIGINKLKNQSGGINTSCVGDQVVRTNWHNATGIWKSGFGQTALAKGTSYEPGVQFYYQTANRPTGIPADIRLQTAYQFVYDGFYQLSK